MLLRKYQINHTLRLYATLSALQLLCFNKNPDDGGGWDSENNRNNLLNESENIFIDLFPEQSIFNQDDMNLRKILEESTFQSWQSHVARKSLVEDLIRFDRNDNDRKITLYPLDIQNETQEAPNNSVSLNYYDRRPFSLLQIPNDTRNLDSMTEYGLDERKPFSFNDLPTQDVFLDNSFYDLHLNTISNASTSSSSSSSHRKSTKNPLKKDAVLPNINRIRRQDIDFFNRYTRESNTAAMREQGTLTMMTNAIYKQDVDLGYTLSNCNQSYPMSSFDNRNAESEKVEVIQNLNDTKFNELNDDQIDVGYLLSLTSSNVLLNDAPSQDNDVVKTSDSQQKLLKLHEDRKLAEILYEQDIDLGYILSSPTAKEASSSKTNDKPAKKIIDEENSNDISDLWAGIPFKIDNETGEYIRLPFEDIFKDVLPIDDPKDDNTKIEDLPSSIDIDATIQEIANLFTPAAEFYAENTPYAHDNLFPSNNNSYASYESQPYQAYDYNRVSNNYYQTNLEPMTGQSSNALYTANVGTHENNHSSVNNDAYLDTILNEECFRMMGISDNGSSATQKHSKAMEASSSGAGNTQNNNTTNSSSPVGVTDFLDLSCGSAGSTIGSLSSESLPSTSDGEWGEGNDSRQDNLRSNFYGPYDYSCNGNFSTKQKSVAQKKYHMFGKRYLAEERPDNTSIHSSIHKLHSQTPITKLEGKENSTFDEFEEEIQAHSSIRNTSKLIKSNVKAERDKLLNSEQLLIRHNHTYALSHSPVSNPEFDRDNSEYGDTQSENGHLTRDEKRARNLNVPIPVHDIINLPMDEFNECVSKYDLNDNQLSLIRDIRRRGKNKVAAQNCRKRKLDTILTLESEVEEVRRRKEKIYNEQSFVAIEKKRIANKFASLHKHIFHYLKDDEGKPCSPSKFSLQQASDGSMYLLPRDSTKQDPHCFMSILMGEASTSGASKDSRLSQEPHARTNLDESKSITQL